MGLSFFVAVHYGVSWQCLAALAFSWALIALFFIDLEHKILPDSVTLSLFWVGLLINTAHIFTSPESALIGAAVGYFIFWSIAFLYQRLRHIEGLGQGDAKLLAACGAWLGWQMLPLIILFSSLLGTVIGSLYLIIRKRNVQEQIPFGPFIAIAAFISMIWGHDIISYYLNLTRMSS
jgi:leader peptidase (prepilin peptidase)/N-methyltransferase